MNSHAFKVGQKVTCNGNHEGRILEIYTGQLKGMVLVRLWQGFRHVGDTCTSLSDLRLENKTGE